MKKFYLIFALFFGLTFNLSAQETVIAVWDFADNSLTGEIHPDFSSAANPDMTYLSGGGSGTNAFTNDDVTGGDFDMSYTMTTTSANTSGWSNYVLNNLDLGPTTGSPTAGSGLVNDKLHLSLSFKSITIAPGSGDKFTIILKDANSGNGVAGGSNEGNGTNHRITGLQLIQNGTNQNIKANVMVYNAANGNGTSKFCGHFGNTQGMTLTDVTIGVTVDYAAGSIRFWINSPDSYASGDGNAWGFKMYNSDGYANTNNFPQLTATPTGNAAAGLANAVVQMLQFSPVITGASEFVFDQIKISTGEYENTVAAGNTSTTQDGVTELFFSKYGEGSSNNKFLEIYNGTNSDIDLSNYAYPSVSNAPTTPGEYEFWNSFDEGAVVAAGDVYVIAHPSADASILAQADETHQYLSNGDDGYALVSGGTFNDADGDGNIDAGEMTGFTIIDWLGDWNGDPGSGWEVAGVSNGTKDHTLTRKWTVCGPNNDWTSSAGTNADDSEWIVGDSDSGWDTIGSFTGCTDTPPFVAPSWAGDWVLDPVAGALAVGPTATDLGWWSSSAADVDTRACLFDDIYRFNIDGSFEQVMQGSTWLEGWQTGAGEECGTPVAPHDGSNPATYSYTGDTVTVVGDGAFLGLAKVHNTGEDGNPVDDTITYNIVSVDDNYLVVNIQFGAGYWQFRFRDANYAPPTTDVTFAVNTANIEVGASGMFLGGGILGDAQAHAMSDDDGDGIWEVTLTLNEGTTGNYIFLNGPADGGDWGAKEDLAGQDCADGQFNDRLLDPVGADDYRIEFCFGECTVECPALDTTAPVITLVGDNPVEVYEGATYTDAGATASDDVDGDLTASIVVVNPVDTSVIGEYTITYNVSDAAGNPATEVTRTVNVVADPCPVVAGAWAHTFDVVEGTVPDAACWLVANGGDANTWVVNTNGEWQIQYSSTAHDDYLISPAFTVISGTSDRFSFEARNQSTFYLETMDVQVWDAGVTTMLGTLATAVGPGTANEAYEYALSAYAGQDVRVAFHITTTDQYYMYVDNVTVDAIPSCQAPTDLSVSGVTATEATVAWSSPNDGGSFEYQVVEGGTTPAETGTATPDSSVDLTGLSSVTTYDFYVRALCSDGSLSDWSSVSFTTELQAPGCGETLSYDYPTGSSGGSQFANNFAGADASDLLFTSTVDNAGDELTLTIGGSTESGWDWVYVTDGAGTVLLAPVSGAMDYEVVSSDGTVNVYIASDGSITQGPVTFAVSCATPFDPPTWVGDWVLDPVAAALAVGPTATDLGWWSNSAADVDTRACLFDDIWSFNEDGTFEIEMQGSTWLEGWQTGAGEECGTPVAPHDGSNPATYSYDEAAQTVTVVGDGAFLGLAKVHNTGEDGNPVDDTITYNIVSVDENYLVVNINFGPGYWQFRFRDANYAPPTTDVTFAVNTANIEVGASGMFLGGGIFGDAQAHAMSDDDGDGIWEVTLTLNEGTTGNYIFLNGPADGGDWGAKEDLAGQDCADGQFNDRLLDPVGADDYRIEFCFGECTVECTPLGLDDPSMSQFTYFPNPVNDQLTINSQRDVKDITVYNMLGQVVVRQTPNMRNCTVDMSSMQTGAYFVQVSIGNTVETVRVLKK